MIVQRIHLQQKCILYYIYCVHSFLCLVVNLKSVFVLAGETISDLLLNKSGIDLQEGPYTTWNDKA